MKRLILFDIDGTLVTGKHGHPKSFSDAIKVVHNIDFKVDWKEIQGMTDQQILTESLLKEGIPKEIIKKNMNQYMDEMKKSFDKSIKDSIIHPLKGVKDLLIKLKSDGALLGLVTGNLVSIAQAKLEKLGLWKYFDVGGFGSDNISRTKLVKIAIKRAQDKFNFHFDNNVILFGDAPQDMNAGIKAEIHTIGVTTGVYSKKELQSVGAKIIIDSLKDTNNVMDLIASMVP